MMGGWFVTGTDTGVGKTWVSLGLMQALQDRGHAVLGMKPVASGCRPTAAGLRNEDAEHLLHQASAAVAYDLVNPYAYEPAIAPHIAARQAGVPVELDRIAASYATLAAPGQPLMVVEGVGGWLAPLGDTVTVADLAGRLNLPVVLVVGMRLGCLNHALLSAQAIRQRGLPLAGWVANSLEPAMEAFDENVRSLAERIPAPLLGIVPHLAAPEPRAVAAALDVGPLLEGIFR